MSVRIAIDGKLPARAGLTAAALRKAAEFFADSSARRIHSQPWRQVEVHLLGDAESAAVNEEIMGHTGPTDVITQRYDAIPGEPDGLVGELFINTDCACREGAKRPRWSPARELLLYAAHGMDHLSGADDTTEAGYRRMRRRELAWMSRLAKIQKGRI